MIIDKIILKIHIKLNNNSQCLMDHPIFMFLLMIFQCQFYPTLMAIFDTPTPLAYRVIGM